MLLELADVILKERIRLYNNIARSDDFTGRLDAELEIKPLTLAELKNPFIGIHYRTLLIQTNWMVEMTLGCACLH